MIILQPREHESVGLIIIWGNGLIGSAVTQCLARLGAAEKTVLPFSWSSPFKQTEELAFLYSFLKKSLISISSQDHTVHLLWSAGAAGFSCESVDARKELDSFLTVLGFAKKLHRECNLIFHMISSAGGLFEGIRRITSETVAVPRRPYGRLKLEQELSLGQSGLKHIVYRPTSVYSFIGKNHRCGFIPALIRNALSNKETLIMGSPSTLRDFIWAGDIGDFAFRQIMTQGRNQFENATYILASERPACLFEVCRWVENVIMRPIPIRYSVSPSNAADITVAAGTAPRSLSVSAPVENIRRILQSMLTRG